MKKITEVEICFCMWKFYNVIINTNRLHLSNDWKIFIIYDLLDINIFR